MEGISDIKIVSLDERRPPRVRKEPYIDLFFKLSHKAPKDWCGQFNDLLTTHQYKPSIDVDEGLFVDAWVRKIDEIPPLLKLLQKNVQQCTENYIARIEEANRRGQGSDDEANLSPEQARLNAVLESLEF